MPSRVLAFPDRLPAGKREPSAIWGQPGVLPRGVPVYRRFDDARRRKNCRVSLATYLGIGAVHYTATIRGESNPVLARVRDHDGAEKLVWLELYGDKIAGGRRAQKKFVGKLGMAPIDAWIRETLRRRFPRSEYKAAVRDVTREVWQGYVRDGD